MSSNIKFRSVKGSRSYLGWAKWEEGEYITGKFIKQTEDRFGNPSYDVEIIETNLTCKAATGGKVVEHEFKEGEMFAMNSNGSLNYRMEDVAEGDIIRVEYQGTTTIESEKSAFKGKECHQVDVQIALDEPSNVVVSNEEVEEDII